MEDLVEGSLLNALDDVDMSMFSGVDLENNDNLDIFLQDTSLSLSEPHHGVSIATPASEAVSTPHPPVAAQQQQQQAARSSVIVGRSPGAGAPARVSPLRAVPVPAPNPNTSPLILTGGSPATAPVPVVQILNTPIQVQKFVQAPQIIQGNSDSIIAKEEFEHNII